MHLVLREAERLDDRVSERRADEGPAVLPATLVPRERPYAHLGQVVREAQAVEDAGRVRADLDPGADLADRARLLVHLHVEAGAVERQRSRQATDPGAHDRDGDVVLRHRARTVGRMLAQPLDEAGGDRVTVTLPPDLSEQALSRALDEFVAAVGSEHVLTSEEDLLEFRDPFWYSGWDDYEASAVVQPETVEEIQEIVRIANEHRVPHLGLGRRQEQRLRRLVAAGARLGRRQPPPDEPRARDQRGTRRTPSSSRASAGSTSTTRSRPAATSCGSRSPTSAGAASSATRSTTASPTCPTASTRGCSAGWRSCSRTAS